MVTQLDSQAGRVLWLKWVLATVAASVVIDFVLRGVEVSLADWFIASVVRGTLMGAIIGVAQWLVLPDPMRQNAGWIVATAAGWLVVTALGMAVSVMHSPMLLWVRIGLSGAAGGIPQWWFLRRYVHRAGWWIVVGGVTTAVTIVLQASLWGTFQDVRIIGSAIDGAVSGAALVWLLRRPRSVQVDAPNAAQSAARAGQAFWVQWVLATGVAFNSFIVVGGLLVSLVLGLGMLGLVAAGALFGGLIGAAQWLVLRRHIRRAGWWVAASAIGWSIGVTAGLNGVFGYPLLPGGGPSVLGAAIGLLAGVGQWLVLRETIEQAGWWVPASGVSWTVMLSVLNLGNAYTTFPLAGIIGGAITGLTLVWLLQNPRMVTG